MLCVALLLYVAWCYWKDCVFDFAGCSFSIAVQCCRFMVRVALLRYILQVCLVWFSSSCLMLCVALLLYVAWCYWKDCVFDFAGCSFLIAVQCCRFSSSIVCSIVPGLLYVMCCIVFDC